MKVVELVVVEVEVEVEVRKESAGRRVVALFVKHLNRQTKRPEHESDRQLNRQSGMNNASPFGSSGEWAAPRHPTPFLHVRVVRVLCWSIPRRQRA